MIGKPLSFLPIFIVIAFLSYQSEAYKCGKYSYNYTLLVLDWPTEFCYHHQTCKPNWKELVSTNQWVIKGFWPASLDVDFLNCIEYEGHDPNCVVEHDYNETSLNAALKVELNTYWPEITTSNDIKEDQWLEHGTCYISVVQTLNSSYIGKEKELFESYFRTSVQKAKQLKLTLTAQQYKNKNDLAQAIGVKPEHFHALCEYDADYLSQVRICYDIKSTVGNETLVSCPSELPNECEFPVKVRTSSGAHMQFLGLLLVVVLALLY